MIELNASLPSHPVQPRKKPLSTVLVTNGYPPSFLQKVTKTRNPTPERETAEFKYTAVLPYIKGVSEPLHRHLQQQGIRTVIKSDTTLRSQLVRPKDPADPNVQDTMHMRQSLHRGNRTTHARKNERTRQGYTTRTHSEFRGFRSCQRNRTQAAVERNQTL